MARRNYGIKHTGGFLPWRQDIKANSNMEVKNLKIEGIKDLSEGHYLLELENTFQTMPLPGQFVHIKVPPFFLRRPFSIAGCDKEKISILFKVAGSGSNVLSSARKGDILSVIGPLGTPFPVGEKREKVFIVAGGTGIAPLIFLSRKLIEKDKEILFFYGARDKKHIMFQLLPFGINFIFSTEDGSYGEKGLINVALINQIESGTAPDVIYAGGPAGLLKKVSSISRRYEIPAFISLENRMACGTGLCYGCVTRIKTGSGWEYKRVCKDGPVFNASEVIWE